MIEARSGLAVTAVKLNDGKSPHSVLGSRESTLGISPAEEAKVEAESSAISAVFKGGGARGVAYAGALLAMESKGFRFKAVAGSSAGAITAGLIASGYSATEIETKTPEALSAAIGIRAFFRAVLSHGVFSKEPLREWIEERLKEKCGSPVESVTFQDLYEASRIELFVVTLDLATKAPLVFSHHRTPHASVSDAVVASCAIPGVFEPGRVSVENGGQLSVHALVDGGAWANFPDFVFCDTAFRTWYGLDPAVSGDVYGFVLDDVLERAPTIPSSNRLPKDRSTDLGLSPSAPRPLLGGVGRLSASWVFRLGMLVASVLTAALITNTMSLAGPAIMTKLGAVPESLRAPTAFVLMALFVLLLVLLGATVLLWAVLGGVVARVVIPAAGAALSPATGVAPWKGQTGCTVISVPARKLKTLGFAMSEETRRLAVTAAYDGVLAQLDVDREPVALSSTASQRWSAAPKPSRHALLRLLTFGAGMAAVVIGAKSLAVEVSGFPGAMLIAAGTTSVVSSSALRQSSLNWRAAHLQAALPQRTAKGALLVATGIAAMVASTLYLAHEASPASRRPLSGVVVQQVHLDGGNDCYQIVPLKSLSSLQDGPLAPPSGTCTPAKPGGPALYVVGDERLRTWSVVSVGRAGTGRFEVLPGATPLLHVGLGFAILVGFGMLREGVKVIRRRPPTTSR